MPPAPFHTGKEEKLVSQVLTPVSHGGQLPGFVRTSPLRPPGPSRPGLMDKGVCPEHQEARAFGGRAGGHEAGRYCSTHGMEGGRSGEPEPLFPKELQCRSPGMVGPVAFRSWSWAGKANTVLRARLRAPVQPRLTLWPWAGCNPSPCLGILI